MIYDTLDHVKTYMGLTENLDVALSFMEKTDFSCLSPGETLIKGRDVFVNVMRAEAKEEEVLAFEVHETYADIQMDICGSESISVGEEGEKQNFSAETDFGTVKTREKARFQMGPGRFIILFPGENHKPGIKEKGQEKSLLKAVIKVKMKENFDR